MHITDNYVRGAWMPAAIGLLWHLFLSISLYLLFASSVAVAEPVLPVSDPTDITTAGFDDSPLKEAIVLPEWFKLSFLDINEDLQDARDAEKHGLIIYFGQKHCPYCKALMEVNFARKDIVSYTQKYFDIIAVDVHGGKMVTDMNGNQFSEREYAKLYETSFTPSLLFYDLDGRLALRLTGYHSPYKFKAALQYVAEDYYKSESFRDYLQRAPISVAEGRAGLNQRYFFLKPPHMLARAQMKAARPLVVFFERSECHACDVLHEGPLGNDINLMKIREFEAVQVDIESEQPIVTPSGQKLTMKSWAEQLEIFHVPTLVFFDEGGDEIIRVDSLIHFYRMRGLLDYILTNGYRTYGNYLRWRRAGPPDE